MKRLKKFFKNFRNEPTVIFENSEKEKDQHIDGICRFKLMLNSKTGKYEKVLVYNAEELTREEHN